MFTKTDSGYLGLLLLFMLEFSEDSSCEPAMIVVVVGVEGNVGGGGSSSARVNLKLLLF